MNFNELKTLTIGGKKVIRILRNDEIVWKFNKLPDEYRETEWIGAAPNSNAYIDLGFPFDSAAKIYMSLWLDSENSNSTYPFGATENEGALRCCLSSPYSGAGYQVFYGSTGSAYFSVSLTKSAPLWSKNDLVMTIKKGMLKLENLTTSSQTTSTNQGEYTMVNNLYLFAQNYNGSARWGSQQRQISKFSYYDKNNKLICNLIPCFRISDGEAGMYDTVRKIFLTNANAASGHKLMRGPVSYTSQNLMPLSTEADGITPYNNGLGYKDNWRVRSEGAEQEQTKISCTGFIPFTKNDKLYIYPPFTGGNTDNAINFSDRYG